MEAPAHLLLLHLRQDVDQSQERLQAHHHQRREVCADEHVEHLLDGWYWPGAHFLDAEKHGEVIALHPVQDTGKEGMETKRTEMK